MQSFRNGGLLIESSLVLLAESTKLLVAGLNDHPLYQHLLLHHVMVWCGKELVCSFALT